MDVVELALPSPAADPAVPPALRRRIEREFAARWQQEWGGKFVLHGRSPGAGSVRLT
jgi:CAI-1 autoinducer synthase